MAYSVAQALSNISSRWITCKCQRNCSTRAVAASSRLVEELLQYVFDEGGKDGQALDIIKSGLGAQPSAEAGIDTARLHLAMAEVERDQSSWAAATDSAAAASKAARAAEPESPEAVVAASQLELAAYTSGVLSYLAEGRDFEALDLAQHALDIAHGSLHQHGAEQQRWQALVSSNSLQCLAQHALGDMSAAATSADVAQALADHTDQRRPGQGQQRDAAIPSALQRIGALRLAMGNYEEATSLFRRAAAGASQALPAGGSTSPGSRLEPSPWALREAAASAVSGVGQASLARAQWDAAEEPLSEGVMEADSITREKHPRAVPILLQLGHLFARTSRVTLAEGIYRQATKILNLDPSKTLVPVPLAHPSVSAMLAWRYAQLLAALPKRETETNAWHKLAHDIHSRSADGQLPATGLEQAYGDLHSLKGQGSPGRGGICDVSSRRVLQYAP